jgi:hypothetical protein
MHVSVVGVYPVESCHLVEVLIRHHTGILDIGGFTQEVPGQPRGNWQAPWDERVLDSDGTKDIAGRFPRNIVADGTPLRVAFFLHFVDFKTPLITPAGAVDLPDPEPRPQRLAFLDYDAPD